MSKRLKSLLVQDLTSRIGDIDDAVIFDFGGLNSEETVGIRASLREVGLTINVVKNSLVSRVLQNRGIEVEAGSLGGPSAVIYGEGVDAVTASKALDDWRTKNKKELKIKAGFLAGEALSSSEAAGLVDMLSPAELRGAIVSVVAGPLSGMVNITNNLLADLPNVLNAIADKKKEGE